jgi:hypothetical protein
MIYFELTALYFYKYQICYRKKYKNKIKILFKFRINKILKFNLIFSKNIIKNQMNFIEKKENK